MSGLSTAAATTVTLATHQGNRSMAANHRYSTPPGHDGRNGGGPQQGSAPLPHIDDLLAVPKDVDPNSSIKRLLEMAETSLRQADMSRDFNRPAQALKDYIRASIIAVQIIRSHKDFPSLKDSSGDLARSHAALLKKISQQNDGYMKIKQDIVADNKRTGVQPTLQRPRSGQANVHNHTASSPFQIPPYAGQDRSKAKPVVHPKPSTMHGNAIKPGHGRASSLGSAAQDSLLSRFTTLSGPQPVPGQDPRIRTHSIVAPGAMPPPPPKGPRAMPPSQKPNVALNSAIPALPKMPDAIYSPARGSISGEFTRPPASTPRGTYSRTGSSTSLSSMATVSQQQQKNDYFASTQSVAEEGQAASLSAELTKSAVITAEDLNELMKSKYSILIIDVRSREAFTQGHIWTAATICIEPTILNRGDMSATEISESLVLSADKEKAAFEDRFKYDFVVFHDQDTENMPEYPKSVADQALTRLRRALVDFSYGTSKLKNPPKLLKGGIDAWVDLMGPSALESGTNSITMAARINNTSQQRQRRNFPVKSLSRNEVETWQDIVNKENTQTASAPAYARSQEEFLRRYPPVVLEQESMTGHTNTNRSSRYGPSVIDLNTDLPTPPTRPAPAVARPSYSGISQALNDDSTYDDTGAPQTQNSLARPKPGEQINVDAMNKTPTGLVNPGNWCYANSILQALLASPGFGRELADSSWQQYARVPRKRNEKIDNPQLMMKILSNLFHWMNTRKFNSMQAQTLMDYCRHLHTRGSNTGQVFGGNRQQDASEFQTFLFQLMDDETNLRRDTEAKKTTESGDSKKVSTLAQVAQDYWPAYRAENMSILDRYWRGHELQVTRCQNCNHVGHKFEPFTLLMVYLPQDNDEKVRKGRHSLTEIIAKNFSTEETLDGYKCDKCEVKSKSTVYKRLVSMPQLLCVQLRRENAYGGPKNLLAVNWNYDDVDLSRWVQQTPGWAGQDSLYEVSTSGSFHYECYAVVVHSGSTLDSGHYFTYARAPSPRQSSQWYLYNDTDVTPIQDIHAAIEGLRGVNTPFLLFFRRKS